MLLNVAFSELKMKKGKVVLTNGGSIIPFLNLQYKNWKRIASSSLAIIRNTDIYRCRLACDRNSYTLWQKRQYI